MNSSISLKGLKVLLAEDNSMNRMVVTHLLKKWEVEITEAVDGAEAVAFFEKGKFDLLLIDLEMPVMDGITALQEIRTKDAEIPAIAFTAASLENVSEHLQKNGFSGFLHKPFLPAELHAKIAECTTAKRA